MNRERTIATLKASVSMDMKVLGLGVVEHQAGDSTSLVDAILVTADGHASRYLDDTAWVPAGIGVVRSDRLLDTQAILTAEGLLLSLRVAEVDQLSSSKVPGSVHWVLDRGGLSRLHRALATVNAPPDPSTAIVLTARACIRSSSDPRGAREDLLAAAQALGSEAPEAAAAASLEDACAEMVTVLRRLAGDQWDEAFDPYFPVAGAFEVQATDVDDQVGSIAPVATEDTAGAHPTCPLCGSAMGPPGKLYQKGTLNDIRFLENDSPRLAVKIHTEARACVSCGHVSLAVHRDR